MHMKACDPCAKRKVRCDKEEPSCSNCKRRKQDLCQYPDLSPEDKKINRLETLVRALGGNPACKTTHEGRLDNSEGTSSAATIRSSYPAELSSLSNSRSKDPVILEEDGQQHYLESRAWLNHGHRQSGIGAAIARNPLLLKNAPNAFQSIIRTGETSDFTTANHARNNAEKLWTTFKQRVHPLVRIVFSSQLDRLRHNTSNPKHSNQTMDAENALVASIYLASINSLSSTECWTSFLEAKTSLLSKYQIFCEEAISRTSILSMDHIMALKALTIYMMVGLDRLSSQSLWTLMGLAIRTGERLGIQRDGSILGLSPFEIEDRRRLWWQLQYLDLILAIRLGATPLTLMADWDVKLPLNIEDNDLSLEMKSFPEARKGITGMSYCLFTYYILDQQRQYHTDKGRFELSWSTNQSVPMKTKEAFIDRLEDGLNQTFLQYCDPIKPLDTLIQLIARALICVFRQRVLLTSGENPGQVNHEFREPLLAFSMQSMEYAIIMHSHRLLKDFEWLTTNGFPWPAFMVVLVEVSRESDANKCQRIWALLSELYTACTYLVELTDDRRRLHAAELIVAAWKTCYNRGTLGASPTKPDLVSGLERRLAECIRQPTSVTDAGEMHGGDSGGDVRPRTPQSFRAAQDTNGLFDLDFQDIDWSFWNSID